MCSNFVKYIVGRKIPFFWVNNNIFCQEGKNRPQVTINNNWTQTKSLLLCFNLEELGIEHKSGLHHLPHGHWAIHLLRKWVWMV
jgi:hypothetical protein